MPAGPTERDSEPVRGARDPAGAQSDLPHGEGRVDVEGKSWKASMAFSPL